MPSPVFLNYVFRSYSRCPNLYSDSLTLHTGAHISLHLFPKRLNPADVTTVSVARTDRQTVPGEAHCSRATDLPPGAAHKSRTVSLSLSSRASTGRREAALRR